MKLTDYFDKHKEIISKHLTTFLEERRKNSPDNVTDHYYRLSDFTIRGKMLRGIFVILAFEAYGGKVNENVLNAAAAMEMAQASFLIHDDIMDRDLLRRGRDTSFAQYIEEGKIQKVRNPEFYGQSMGIVSGDLTILMSYELLSLSSGVTKISNNIVTLAAREMQNVALGQFMDYVFGQTHSEPSEDQILTMYEYKTGGYTFALPFIIGALLAGANDREIAQLNKMGRYLGTIFQIKDDEMAIFEDEEKIGKPVGSDIRENKKTLIRCLLYKKATNEESRFLDSCFGNQKITQQNIKELQDVIIKYHIRDEIHERVENLSQKALQIIQTFNIVPEYNLLFKELEHYNKTRST